MKTLVKRFRDFLHQCAGPTAVEYAVLLVLIIFGALTAITLLGSALDNSVRSTAQATPSGNGDEDFSESSQAEEDEDEENGRGGRGRGGRGRGGRGRGGRGRSGRASALPASSPNFVRRA